MYRRARIAAYCSFASPALHSVPDGDDRPKRCNMCHTQYEQSGDGCPLCRATTFELVTPDVDNTREECAGEKELVEA